MKSLGLEDFICLDGPVIGLVIAVGGGLFAVGGRSDYIEPKTCTYIGLAIAAVGLLVAGGSWIYSRFTEESNKERRARIRSWAPGPTPPRDDPNDDHEPYYHNW